LEVTNIIFTIIFAMELVVKIIGLGIVQYMSSGLNIFDFVVVLSSLVEFVAPAGNARMFQILRAFRVLRIFKLIRGAEGL
jgi:hypothetical protein